MEDSSGEWAEVVKITACPAERKEVRLLSPSEHTSHGQGGHGGDGSQRRSGDSGNPPNHRGGEAHNARFRGAAHPPAQAAKTDRTSISPAMPRFGDG